MAGVPEIHGIEILLKPLIHMILKVHDDFLPSGDLHASGLGYVKYFFDIV